MKKQGLRFIAALLLLALAVGSAPAAPAAAPSPIAAAAGNISLSLDGTDMKLGTYIIASNNYVKLRDVAQLLNGTAKQFSVTWNGAAQRIDLVSGAPYTPEGGELAPPAAGEQNAVPNAASVWLDGAAVSLTAYTINGNNFFKLRDLGIALDFYVGWDGATSTVIVDTSRGYTEDPAVVARAMQAVLDQELAAQAEYEDWSRSLDARLIDLNGDGIKEMLVINSMDATLYTWENNRLESKMVGGLAGGSLDWWLCRDMDTGELGIEWQNSGGGDFGGSESTFYYADRKISISDHSYSLWDENGEDLGWGETDYRVNSAKVTQAEYEAVRGRNMALIPLISDVDSFYGTHLAETQAELALLSQGKSLRDLSDQVLLELAQGAVYDILSLEFTVDTSSILRFDQDWSDCIICREDGSFAPGVPFEDGWPYYRVIGFTELETLDEAQRTVWDMLFSRKYSSFEEAVAYRGDIYVSYNGALYLAEVGMGDEGLEWVVDELVSRTDDEAVFRGHVEDGNRTGFTFSLVYEDGTWKYGKLD